MHNRHINYIRKFIMHSQEKSVIWSLNEQTNNKNTTNSFYQYRALGNKNKTLRNKNLAVANRSRVSCVTQYAEGIYDNPVTLKFRLTVTQGHWKRNHWVDHTRLTIRRVIGRWILSWPWKVGQRSVKVIEISAIRKLGCGFLFAFYSNYGLICRRLWDCQRKAWPWKPG